MRRRDLFIVAVLAALAALIRAVGLSNELWLDEVWSLTNALSAHSVIDVFTRLRTDNNHHLITLWMYFVGEHGSALIYRLPSFVGGVATVVMAFALGRRSTPTHAVVTAALFGLSFPLVYYSSEARGYAPVIFFTLAAWLSLERFVAGDGQRWAASFWVCCVLGVLAHQTFVGFFIAALLWCDLHTERMSRSVRSATRTTMVAFAVPAVVMGLFYIAALRGTEIQGGPRSPLVVVVAQALSLLASGPIVGSLMWITATVMLIAFAAATVLAYRRHDDVWLMYIMAGVVLPAVFVALQPSSASYTRYFLVPGAVVLLAVADLLARGVERGGVTRTAVGVALAGVAIGCTAGLQELWVLGRGRYDDAVRRMTTAAAVVTVASAHEYTLHDFRSEMLIRYYARVLGVGDRIRYVSFEQYPSSGTDWMIRESINGQPPDQRFTDQYGNTFVFDREYKAARLAGIAWCMYKR